MPISDLVDFEEDEGEGKGERQNVYSCECCVGVYVPIVIISRFFRSSYMRRHSQLDTTAFVYVHVTKMYDTHEPQSWTATHTF